VKDNKEKDKIRAKPNKIKSKREARKSPDSSPTKSKPSQSQESIKPRWENDPRKLGAAPDTLRVAPPSADYIPGPKEPQTPPAPQDEDEHKTMFIQPHDPDFSLEYVAESDPKEDPEVYEDDETEDGPVDYLIDGGDDGDDDDDDSSGDDDYDEDEEEEEHLAPTNSTVILPTDELFSPPGGTEHVIPPPSTDTATTGARITVRLQAAMSFPPKAKVERLLAMPTPSPSPLASLSPPSAGERLARFTAPDASPLPPPLPMPPHVDRKDDIHETEMPPRKRLCLSTLGSRYEVRESFTARPTGGRRIDYGFVSTLDAEARRRGIREVMYGIRDTWTLGTNGRDTLSNGRHETRDERHVGRVASTAPTGGRRIDYGFVSTLDAEARRRGIREVMYGIRDTWVDPKETVPKIEPMTVRELHTHQTQLQLQGTLIQTQHQLHETCFQIQQAEIAEVRETDRRR
nr:hypothetical protein [Tanacetum cinerariifolium]